MYEHTPGLEDEYGQRTAICGLCKRVRRCRVVLGFLVCAASWRCGK